LQECKAETFKTSKTEILSYKLQYVK